MSSTHWRPIRLSLVAALVCCASLAGTASMAAAGTRHKPSPVVAHAAAYACTWIANGAPKPPWGVWLRSGASTAFPTVGDPIPNGTVFAGSCGLMNNFVKTTYKGVTGYANRAYLIEILD
jgi:hypothetical protein